MVYLQKRAISRMVPGIGCGTQSQLVQFDKLSVESVLLVFSKPADSTKREASGKGINYSLPCFNVNINQDLLFLLVTIFTIPPHRQFPAH